MNLLRERNGTGMEGGSRGRPTAAGPPEPPAAQPEVPHMVEHGLLVEDAPAAVHDDGAVHVIFHPVGPPLQIQRQVPVRPAGHEVVQYLKGGVGGSGGGFGAERGAVRVGGGAPIGCCGCS